MFEHLDDPQPFFPDGDFRRGVHRRGERLRLRRRVTAAATGLAVTVAAVGLAGGLYVQRRDAAIDRVTVEAPSSVDGATNILLVGLDSRRELDEPGADTVVGSRSDTMVVVRLQEDGSVGLLPIPRDLEDPATGERLNAASAGGPQALIDTIHSVTGVPVDHYVELDLHGFIDLVDELGGVQLAIDRPLVDRRSGLQLGPSPCATFDGRTALALARARHVEGDPASDLGRMSRGQAALTALIGQLGEASGDPATIDHLTRVLADHATLDDGLTLRRLADIAHALASAGPERVASSRLPMVATPDGRMLRLAPEAAALLHTFGAPDDFVVPPLPTDPSGGTVGVPGHAPAPEDVGIGPCRS
jgi:LCP family protein required for cell wall assembly